ncbi:SUMF1/EgtB/PvdO family nonheme iron enzyme [bacterium]|nr:SUMF1/EgtB/PvdO family nonheme iron enzyme [bacterium]
MKLNIQTDLLHISIFLAIFCLMISLLQGCSSKTTLIQSDNIPPTVIHVDPGDGNLNVSLNNRITIVFSEAMDITSINTGSKTKICDGTVQVSSDGFQSCLPLFDPLPDKEDKSFKIIPISKFDGSTEQEKKTYRLRVTTGVKNRAGSKLREQYNMQIGFTVIVAMEYEGLVLIPDGKFQMGDNFGDDDEQPVHTVTLKSFYMSDHEVTVTEYKTFIEEVLFPVNSGANHTFNKPGLENYPINYVSWRDAQAYISWLNTKTVPFFRLCSEAEWEYAVRAGLDTRYSCGNEKNCLNSTAWYNSNNEPYGPKSTKSKTANNWGLFDMHGNLWEWVQDNYHPSYENAPDNGDPWENGDLPIRVIRGGNYYMSSYSLRSANRNFYIETASGPSIGFRLCADNRR